MNKAKKSLCWCVCVLSLTGAASLAKAERFEHLDGREIQQEFDRRLDSNRPFNADEMSDKIWTSPEVRKFLLDIVVPKYLAHNRLHESTRSEQPVLLSVTDGIRLIDRRLSIHTEENLVCEIDQRIDNIDIIEDSYGSEDDIKIQTHIVCLDVDGSSIPLDQFGSYTDRVTSKDITSLAR